MAQIFTLFFNDMHRSFAALRMTTKRNVVILSGAKDLYEMIMAHIPINRLTQGVMTLLVE